MVLISNETCVGARPTLYLFKPACSQSISTRAREWERK